MRLTLRTLLAYLDDLLEPNDARELGTKVRDSEFASGLVHRIRSVIGRLRLSAPNVLGRGIGADANTVAEYLDNTFPPDRVPEFEKICLESDMHLAEVASCHQVLALVLGEPAQVSPRLRDRVHGLLPAASQADAPQQRPRSPAQAAASDREGQAGAASGSMEPSVARPSRRESSWREGELSGEEPDYVAAGRRRGFPAWLSGLLAGFLLTAILVAGYLWISRPHELAEAPVQPRTAGHQAGPEAVPPADLDSDRQLEAGSGRASDQPGPEPTNIASDFEPVQPSSAAPLAPPLLVPAAEPDSATETPAEGATAARDNAGPVSAAPAPPGPVRDASQATQAPDMPAGSGEDAKTAEPPAAASEKNKDLGRFVSEDQLLAVWDEQQASWVRLPPRSKLLSGIHLRVPTLFRPQLVLSSGLQITLNDVTDAQLSIAAEETTTIVLEFGQAMVSSISGEGQQLVLKVAEEAFGVKLIDGLSQFAVEVRHVRSPGADPLAGQAPAVVRIWPTGGSLEIQRGNETQQVEIGNMWVFDGQVDVRPAEKLPQWVSSSERKEIDRLAQFRLANELGFDRALTLSLAELAADGPTETRSLASRVLASLDRFEPLIDSFAEPKQHFAWTAHYAALQDAIARSPQTANLVHNAAQNRWGADFEPMWRMIIGYDPGKLAERGAAQLVSALEHEQLEFRVIAIESLRAITGVDYFYEPQRPSRRRDSVRRWQRELEAGRIKYKSWPPDVT